MQKFLEACVEISSKAEGKFPVCTVEFATPKGNGGLTEACADGNRMLIFGCREFDR